MKGKIRRAFPGANTCEGFYSLFENIIGPDAQHIFIMKGGPGVGKSTFIKSIGSSLLDKGYDLEYFHCSADADSLDAMSIPSLGIVLLDGTAPHINDPKMPGLIDEIINLGEYWDENKLRKKKTEIIPIYKKNKRFFQIAFSNLREAKVVYEEIASYYAEAVDIADINKQIKHLCSEIFEGIEQGPNTKAVARRLFASSNTPSGLVNFLDLILQDVKKLYLLKGEPGTGMEKALQEVLEQALRKGQNCEAYHCSLKPSQLEAVYLPSQQTALVRLNDRLVFEPGSLPGLKSLEIIDFNQLVNTKAIQPFMADISDAKERLQKCFERAWEKLRQAKAVHDILENAYVEAMDFGAINQKRDMILDRILKYCEK